MQARQFFLPFEKKEQVAESTFVYYFRRDPALQFLAGQYLQMSLPHLADDFGTSRFFTIASSPHDVQNIQIITTKGQSSFKKTLFQLEKGDVVSCFCPLGKVVLVSDAKPVVLLASGLGITPFISIVTSMQKEKVRKPVTLFSLWKKRSEAVYYNEFLQIAKENKNFHYLPFFTSERNKTEKKDHSLIEKALLTRCSYWEKARYYIVGSPTAVSSLFNFVSSLGISEQNIIIEQYTSE